MTRNFVLPKCPFPFFPLIPSLQLLHQRFRSGNNLIHGRSICNQHILNTVLYPIVHHLTAFLLMAMLLLKGPRCSLQLMPCQLLRYHHLGWPKHVGCLWLISATYITSLMLTSKNLLSWNTNLATRWL